jgi:hypothetical protein
MTIPPQVCVTLQDSDSCRADTKRQDERAEAAQYLEGDSKYVLEEPRFEYGTYERTEPMTSQRVKWPTQVRSFVDGYEE